MSASTYADTAPRIAKDPKPWLRDHERILVKLRKKRLSKDLALLLDQRPHRFDKSLALLRAQIFFIL